MPLPKKRLDRHRVDFAGSLTQNEIDQLISDPDVQTLQCSEHVELDTWDLLNRSLFIRRPEIELRVYGFYSSVCDLSFVRHVRNVRRFSADCLTRTTGIEHLAALENLEELAVGIYNLESFEFLNWIPDRIKALSLMATKSKRPRLDLLSRFHSLSRLYLEGQQRGIEVLSQLMKLGDLTLRSISTDGLDYISSLPQLWSLDIKLGGTRNLSAIAHKESIKYLELWQITGLADIGLISSLSGLQHLFLHSLKNVKEIPVLSKLAKLRRLHLENMKGLQDVSGVFRAPALEEFMHISAQNIPPEKYKALMGMPTLRQLLVGFGSRRKNEEFEQLVLRSGKTRYSPTQFIFQ